MPAWLSCVAFWTIASLTAMLSCRVERDTSPWKERGRASRIVPWGARAVSENGATLSRVCYMARARQDSGPHGQHHVDEGKGRTSWARIDPRPEVSAIVVCCAFRRVLYRWGTGAISWHSRNCLWTSNTGFCGRLPFRSRPGEATWTAGCVCMGRRRIRL